MPGLDGSGRIDLKGLRLEHLSSQPLLSVYVALVVVVLDKAAVVMVVVDLAAAVVCVFVFRMRRYLVVVVVVILLRARNGVGHWSVVGLSRAV